MAGRRKITTEQLKAKLRDHRAWLVRHAPGNEEPLRIERGDFSNVNWNEIAPEAGIDLSHAQLPDARLNCPTRSHGLDNAILNGANLRNAVLTGDFWHMSFRGADLTGATFRDVEFNTCDFTGATMNGATFNKARFCWSSCLKNASLQGAHIERTIFDNTDCDGADFSHATVRGRADPVTWHWCSLRGAVFDHANLKKTAFHGLYENSYLDATGISMRNITADNCEFGSYVIMDGADFSEARLSDIVFEYSTMKDVILDRSDMSQIRIRGTNVEGMSLRGAAGVHVFFVFCPKMNDDSVPPEQHMDFGDFKGRYVHFESINLNGANFENGVFHDSEFGMSFEVSGMSGRKLSLGDCGTTPMYGARFQGADLTRSNMEMVLMNGDELDGDVVLDGVTLPQGIFKLTPMAPADTDSPGLF